MPSTKYRPACTAVASVALARAPNHKLKKLAPRAPSGCGVLLFFRYMVVEGGGSGASAETARNAQPVLVSAERAQGAGLAAFDPELARHLKGLEMSPQL